MKKIVVSLLIGLGLMAVSAPLTGAVPEILKTRPAKGSQLEILEKAVASQVNRTFAKRNLYSYRKYKDILNQYKNSPENTLTPDIKQEIAVAKRDKAEADAEVPTWNQVITEVDKFVQQHRGSKKSDDYQDLTKAMADIKRESDKLVNTITMVHNTFFGGDENIVFGSAKAHEDTKWEFMYIRNNLDALVSKLESKKFDTPGKKEAQWILIFVAVQLRISALKASNDLVAEMKKRKSVSA